MEHHIVLRVIAKLVIPMILIFALYVQFHGEYGPGGGFQAGVIFAAGFIIHALIFGIADTSKVLPIQVLRFTAATGLLLYLSTGVAGILMGGNFLDYNVLAEDPVGGQHLGILLVEMGVGMTVASTMLILFYSFSRPG